MGVVWPRVRILLHYIKVSLFKDTQVVSSINLKIHYKFGILKSSITQLLVNRVFRGREQNSKLKVRTLLPYIRGKEKFIGSHWDPPLISLYHFFFNNFTIYYFITCYLEILRYFMKYFWILYSFTVITKFYNIFITNLYITLNLS